MPAMDATTVGVLLDAMDNIIEVTNGYKNKLISAGYTEAIAQQMTVDFHRFMIESVSAGQK